MASNKISLSLRANFKPPVPTNGVKRPRAALHDEEDEGQGFGRSEKVSHFDRAAGGAVDESQMKEDASLLIIAKQSNRDWREAANRRKRQKSGLPNGGGAGSRDMDQKMNDVEAADAVKKPGFGLNLYKKEQENGHVEEQEMTVEESQTEDAPKQRTDDELAMDALLGKTMSDKTLMIEQAEESLTESDAFKHDFRGAPDMATLEEYARVPVEQFGAALLRGMGWKDGEGIGSQKGKKLPKDTGKLPERRANLLGIGAKEDPSVAAEMGAWGRHAKGGKEVKIYNPVLLRDKKTGEMFTEDELKKKQEADEKAKYEEEFERKERDKRRRRDEEESKDRRREKGRDRDDRRDRDRDRDRRKYDDGSDEEYRQRKEKERRRRKERKERDDGHDRERSRRHRDYDDDRDRRRDSDKDRDRRR